MEEELKNLIKVWLSVILSVSYCYFLPKITTAGIFRLLLVLPVCTMFLILPLFFSSVLLTLYTTFFLSIASLKLIQFSFDQGPLFPIPHNLFRFICFTCFPIKLQQNPKYQNHFPRWFYAVKVAIFIVALHLYDYIEYLPSILILGLYLLHAYLELEVLLVPLKSLFTIILGCDLEPHFNEPYLATSLQDFWGRRWNLMVTDVLRSSVYFPVREFCEQFMNIDWAAIVGVLATFTVSGVAHEVLFFYLSKELPTGEVAIFFVLHGVCTVVEGLVKKKTSVRRWLPVSPVVSPFLAVGFVGVSSGLLFFPRLKRSNVMERGASEAMFFVDFFKRKFIFSW